MIDDILTKREKEVIRLACKGLDNTQIAQKMFLSPLTIHSHLDNIFIKLGVNNTNGKGNRHTRIKAIILYLREHKELLDELD